MSMDNIIYTFISIFVDIDLNPDHRNPIWIIQLVPVPQARQADTNTDIYIHVLVIVTNR